MELLQLRDRAVRLLGAVADTAAAGSAPSLPLPVPLPGAPGDPQRGRDSDRDALIAVLQQERAGYEAMLEDMRLRLREARAQAQAQQQPPPQGTAGWQWRPGVGLASELLL